MDIEALVAHSVAHQASDLHLSAGMPPMLRVHGDLVPLPYLPLTAETALQCICACMTSAQREQYAQQRHDLDFSWEAPGLARFRVNAFHQLRGPAAALRTIAARLPTLAQLQAPPLLAALALQPRGLVLVTGPTGCGKSTTLAAMVEHRNQQQAGHILTIEDPIEFIHTPQRCLINQRELGTHCGTFAQALQSALRTDPDCILVGEMRDISTIRLALTAAETGHLVLASLHTAGAAQAVDRIIDVFPGDEKLLVRAMLAESLQAVVAQTLCKTSAGDGRVAAFEVMLATPAIRHLIREGKTAQMASVIQTGRAQGMQTLEQSLNDLRRAGTIHADTVRDPSLSADPLGL